MEPADGPEAVAAAIAAAAAAHLSVNDDMDIDTDTTHPQQPQTAAGAAAGAGAVAGDMPPPANRSAKRNKAAISSSSSQAVGTNSPFGNQRQGTAAAAAAGAPAGLSPLVAVHNPGHQGPAAALNRSASQSPPYKAPRYRRKQTPSRFYCPAEATAARDGTGEQQDQQQWGSQLEEVVVMGGSSSGGGSSDAAPTASGEHHTQGAVNGAPPPAQKGSPAKGQQQAGTVQKAQLKSSGSIGSNGAGSPGDTVQQLLTQARAAAQQQRWQQLQQQLKGRSLAGGGVLAEQLEAQEQMTQVQVREQRRLHCVLCCADVMSCMATSFSANRHETAAGQPC